jgi:hypothetical protein
VLAVDARHLNPIQQLGLVALVALVAAAVVLAVTALEQEQAG